MTMTEEEAREYGASIDFLRALANAKTVTDVNIAAGVFLQELGEEPADE